MITVDDVFGMGAAYEMYALANPEKAPPITRLCRQHPWLVVPVAAVFLAHLLYHPKTRVVL